VDKEKSKEICNKIETYLQSKNGLPVPSLEDFCISNNYYEQEIKDNYLLNKDLRYAVESIKTKAIVILESLLVIETNTIELQQDGKKVKLDKSGIKMQLRYLKNYKYTY